MLNRKETSRIGGKDWAHRQYARRHAQVMDRLPVPDDVEKAHELFEANCGPVALAAVLGLSVMQVMVHFPQFPTRPWTNLRSMTKALNGLDVGWVVDEGKLPLHGLALVQWEGPWMGSSRNARRYTHWLAVFDEYVFDVNWHGWLPQPIWEELVVPQFMNFEPRISGWSVHLGLEIHGEAGCSWPRPVARPW